MKKQEYKEQERHYYFFDYLFWLGEITWEHYHKVRMNVRGIFFLLGVPVGRSGFTFQVLA
ncbi:hypothetical protein [Bacteroides thetaiotaomicron]|uniref:Uncharacterized protein n=1 Tax=Bacteroides thetaiotaomicron TaxID=818 RepID=A0AAP3SGI0_BACT4|nr:hypothetical protein [Bacteroides thetaiotaomicron]MDC2217889.1 hypothetical protein [Bacteroides thetaiotaomicron]MDC2224025.1 hypothetical protein [Bacteroides thetaiotaomicron]MDC2238049.1 hypothetical protein [Bacteroides thetaiotaomicron]